MTSSAKKKHEKEYYITQVCKKKSITYTLQKVVEKSGIKNGWTHRKV